MLGYKVELTDDDDSVMVTFPDFPEAVTFGDNRDDALGHAVDALQTAMMAYMADRRDIPAPYAIASGLGVSLPLLAMLKVEIYRAMRSRGWRKADLARALHKDPRQVDRLVDLRYATPVAQMEAALRACGQVPVVTTQALAA